MATKKDHVVLKPTKRKPLVMSPAMKQAAERARAAQPIVKSVASNTVEWREVFPR